MEKLRKDYPETYKKLTLMEFKIANKMYENKGEILQWDEFCELLSHNVRVCQQNNIAVHVRGIRSKFAKSSIPLAVETYLKKGWLLRKK